MLRYNRKIPCTLEGHSKKLSFILGGIQNICIVQNHNNVHISSMGIDVSYPMKIHSRPYGLSIPVFRYFKNKYSSMYYEAYIEEAIPMSTMVKKSKNYKDNR